MWGNIANELKGYNNVIFELWNEPAGDAVARDTWFSAVQQCITSIRATEADQLILVHWGYSIWENFQFPGGGFTLSWIENYPLTDSLGNIAYSAHFYRGFQKQTVPEFIYAWEYDDMKYGFELCLVDYILDTLNRPVIFGEIGANIWWTGEKLERELAAFSNSLLRFNELGIGYLAWWWWNHGTQYRLLTGDPNFKSTSSGQILIDSITNRGGQPKTEKPTRANFGSQKFYDGMGKEITSQVIDLYTLEKDNAELEDFKRYYNGMGRDISIPVMTQAKKIRKK